MLVAVRTSSLLLSVFFHWRFSADPPLVSFRLCSRTHPAPSVGLLESVAPESIARGNSDAHGTFRFRPLSHQRALIDKRSPCPSLEK